MLPQKVFERGFIHVMAYDKRIYSLAPNTNFTTYSSHFLFSIFSPKLLSHEKKINLTTFEFVRNTFYHIFEPIGFGEKKSDSKRW